MGSVISTLSLANFLFMWSFLRNSFSYVVHKATTFAKHVAIKNTIQYLAKFSSDSDTQILALIDERKSKLLSSTLDIAYV